MTTPRPDQQHGASVAGASGSRSGSGDVAAALGYPGVPPAIPNCQAAQQLQANAAGAGLFFTFTAPGRIWQVLLAYTITSNNSFALATTRTVATITAGTLPLAVVQLGVAGPDQADSGVSEPSYGGLPVVAGTSLTLNINNGLIVANLDQQASAIVLYSIP